MSNYNIKLTPDLINPGTEGSLDTSIFNGKSLQRTLSMTEIVNGENRKMIANVQDGAAIDNVTFQNSNGIGNISLSGWSFDTSKLGPYVYLMNNNLTVAAIIEGSFADEGMAAIGNYAIQTGQKVMFSIVVDKAADYTEIGIANDSFDVSHDFVYSGYDRNQGIRFNGQVSEPCAVGMLSRPEIESNITIDLTFQQDGDIVDVAVDRANNLIWYRVNNSAWNNDATQNPTTATGGYDISCISGNIYPVVVCYYDAIMSVNVSSSNLTGFDSI
jgi:hypothetical protein